MKYTRVRFDNGLRLVTCCMPEMKSVTMGVWVGVGGRHEEDVMSGVSHFLEHMLFKGTKSRTAVQISQAIEGVGGNMNAFTTEECTCFYAKVMGDHFSQALEVLADMIQSPSFNIKDIERERGVILEELRMNVDVPSHYVFELLGKVMWPKHPLGRMLIGTEQTIRGFKREDFIHFKNKNYTAENTVVSIAGCIDEKKVRKEVERRFAFLKGNGAPGYIRVSDAQRNPQYEILKKKTEQTHFCIGIRALHRNHPDRFVLRVLNALLGENMSSRLFQEIREKLGLSYDISSSVERFQDTGSLVISAGVDIRHLPKVLEGTLKELQKIKRRGVTKKELELAKEYCVGQAALGMERTSNQMTYMGESELCSGQILSLDELIRRMRRVKSDDIQRVARDLFVNQNLNLAIIGPVDKETRIRNLFYVD